MADLSLHGESADEPFPLVSWQPASLSAVFDAVPVGLCVIDRDWRLVSMNRRMAEVTGRAAETVIGRSLIEVTPAAAAQIAPQLQRALRGERVLDLEVRGPQMGNVSDGRVFLLSLEPLCVADTVCGVLCSMLDITERKRTEESLREHREQLSNLIDQAAVGICQSDLNGRYLLVNDRFCEILGRKRQELLGTLMRDVTHPDDVPTNLALLKRLVETGDPFSLEKRYVRPDGALVWVYNYVSATHDASGHPRFVIVVSQDVTKRKQAEEALRDSETRLRLATEGAGVGTWETDHLLGVGRFSPEAMMLLGTRQAAYTTTNWIELVHPQDRAAVMARWRRAVAEGGPYEMEYRPAAAPPDGNERWLLSRGRLDRDAAGRPVRAAGVLLDVTARRRAEMALRDSDDRFNRAIAAARISTWECDLVSGSLQVSKGFDELFGQPPGALRSMDAAMNAVNPEDRPSVTVAVERGLGSKTEADSEVEFRVPAGDGTDRWLRAQWRTERGLGGKPRRLVGVTQDVTERRRAQQQIAYLAYHDPLTGLANRRLFRQTLETALASAGRSRLLAVHCLDLDQFKGINDTLGHPTGDALLRQAAERLRSCMRPGEMVARLGGDEFAIIQGRLQRPEDAAGLALRVIETLEQIYDIDGQMVAAGASIGIAVAPDDGATADELLRNVDIALYRAKADGRGSYRFFEPAMDEALRLKQDVKVGLRTALAGDDLELHFQPLVATDSNEITCCEALMRWRHPARGLVYPADFILTAEETGLIVPMGEWALRTACREAVQWPHSIRVAVNLSPVQFRNPGLLRAVTGALEDSGLAADRLELEITESVLLQDDEANLAILRALRALGVRIVMDDFGTGYSSLGYLLRFPFDKLKIDRSFVVGLPHRKESDAIVRAIIGMGQNLAIPVTAEGVETIGQLEALRSRGCSEVQGFLFSRPVPAAEISPFLSRRRPTPAPAHRSAPISPGS